MKINKQNLIYLAVIVLTIVVIILFWYLASSKSNILSTAAQVEKVIDGQVINPVLDLSGQNILYFNIGQEKDLAFYAYNLQTKENKKISDEMDVPDRVIWSPDRRQAILKVTYDKYIFEKINSQFADPSLEDRQEMTWLIDFRSNKLSRLNLNIQNVAWLNNNQIVYHLYEPPNNINAIFLADANGSNWEKIKDVNFSEGVGLGPLSQEEIFYYPLGFEIQGNNIYKINLKNKTSIELIKNDAGGQAVSSTAIEKIIYQIFHRQNKNFTLGLMNKDGTRQKDLNIQTDINRVGFNQNYLVVASRKQNEETDTFYRVNIQNMKKEKIGYQKEISIDAQNLMLSPDSKTIYFISNDFLYKIEL